MPTTLFCQHPELPSIQQYVQTFSREAQTNNAYLTNAKTATMLHPAITQVRQFTSFGCHISYHTSHREASLCASPQENFKSAFMRNKLNSLLPPKRTLLSSLIIGPTLNSTVLFFQGYVTKQLCSTFIYLWSQLFLLQTLCLCMQKHICFFSSYAIKQNQPYP